MDTLPDDATDTQPVKTYTIEVVPGEVEGFAHPAPRMFPVVWTILTTPRFTLRHQASQLLYRDDYFEGVGDELHELIEKSIAAEWKLEIFLVERNRVGWDEYNGFAVYAGNEYHALLVAIFQGEMRAKDWFDSKVTRPELDPNGCLIYDSFNAG